MANVLSRGWSPTKRQYRLLRLGLAVLLVTSPALVYVSGYGQPTYRYEAVEIGPADGGFEHDADGPRFVEGFEGVDCYRERDDSRTCLLERRLVDGNVTVDEDHAGYPTVDELYTYHDGQFYERYDTVRNGTLVLALRPVSADAVLSTISYDFADLDGTLQRAVAGDAGTAHRDLDADGRIVWYDGRYYAISEADYSEPKGRTASSLAAIAGLWLLWRSVRVELRD